MEKCFRPLAGFCVSCKVNPQHACSCPPEGSFPQISHYCFRPPRLFLCKSLFLLLVMRSTRPPLPTTHLLLLGRAQPSLQMPCLHQRGACTGIVSNLLKKQLKTDFINCSYQGTWSAWMTLGERKRKVGWDMGVKNLQQDTQSFNGTRLSSIHCRFCLPHVNTSTILGQRNRNLKWTLTGGPGLPWGPWGPCETQKQVQGYHWPLKP